MGRNRPTTVTYSVSGPVLRPGRLVTRRSARETYPNGVPAELPRRADVLYEAVKCWDAERALLQGLPNDEE